MNNFSVKKGLAIFLVALALFCLPILLQPKAPVAQAVVVYPPVLRSVASITVQSSKNGACRLESRWRYRCEKSNKQSCHKDRLEKHLHCEPSPRTLGE